MLIARYFFRQTSSALLMILISLTLIVWLTSVLREIKLLTSEGQTFWLFMKITGLTIPNLIVMVAPVAYLIACLHTLNRLNGDSELIVLSASGASVWRIFARASFAGLHLSGPCRFIVAGVAAWRIFRAGTGAYDQCPGQGG
jgi:lipopolysaccharide export system permease protein